MDRAGILGELKSYLKSISLVFRNEKEFRDDMSAYFQRLGYIVHVEYSVPLSDEVDSFIFVDLVLEKDGVFFPIELKYKTKQLSADYGHNVFDKHFLVEIVTHSANNDNCFLVWKDVQRIEELASRFSIIPGCVVVLTNDSLYWRGPKDNPAYKPVSIEDGKEMSVGPAGFLYKGAKKDDNPLILRNKYFLRWEDTSRDGFRFLIIG